MPLSGHAGRLMPDAWRRQHALGRQGGRERARKACLTHVRRSAAHNAMKRQVRAAFVQLRDMVRAHDAELRGAEGMHRQMLRRLGR